MLRHSAPGFRRVLITLRLTGCRPGEIRALIWEWVEFERAPWVIPEHKTITRQREPRPRISRPYGRLFQQPLDHLDQAVFVSGGCDAVGGGFDHRLGGKHVCEGKSFLFSQLLLATGGGGKPSLTAIFAQVQWKACCRNVLLLWQPRKHGK